QGLGYLNYEQSPVAALPRPQFTFRTTPGAVRNAQYAEPYQPQPIPKPELKKAGADISIMPTQGPVGAHAVLKGRGFSPGAAMRLAWETSVGSRVSGEGFTAQENPIGEVSADANGRVDAPVTIPDDLGGLHALVLRSGSGEGDPIARLHFVIETSILEMS